MSAKRLGFERVFTPLSEIDRRRTGLLDGSLAPVRFFTESILPLVEAAQKKDKFSISRIIRQNSPLLTPQALKEASDPGDLLKSAQSGVEELKTLWDNNIPACGDVLKCVAGHKLFNIPDALLPVIDIFNVDK